ncbi:hypothetical protein [Pendulispora albinea]|uniref:Uncharacterized protein n=1 Tax=Pendulispora albinea TaxID=2741071 RepID=A0ABZ2LQJ4_9BACT
MNPRKQVPVYLRYAEDGTTIARCPSLNCHCEAPSRAQALRTIQLLMQEATAAPVEGTGAALRHRTNEVVFVAVAPPARRGIRRKTAERVSRWRRLRVKCDECLEAVRHLEAMMKAGLPE